MGLSDGRRYAFLGYPITGNDPNPPAIPPVEITRLYSIADDAANVFVLKLANHSGTHVDAPSHVVEGGISITEFEPQELVFQNPVLVDIPAGDCQVVGPQVLESVVGRAKGADLLLLRFGYGPVRSSEPARYKSKCPGFGIPGARFLLHSLPGLRAVGMDVPSFACIEHLDQTMAAHNVMLEGEGRRFLIIEDMNLNQDLTGLCRVYVAPWWVAGIDSAPCTVMAELHVYSS